VVVLCKPESKLFLVVYQVHHFTGMELEQTGKLVERSKCVDANGTLAVQVFRLDQSE
jgi:hypothetical protein